MLRNIAIDVTTNSSLGLLEWLTELRETFYLSDYQFIKKGGTQEQSEGGGTQTEQGRGKISAYFPWLLPQNLSLRFSFINPEAFCTLSFWIYGSFITQVGLVKSSIFGDLHGLGWRTRSENSNSNLIVDSIGLQPDPIIRCFPKVTSLEKETNTLVIGMVLELYA